MRKYVLLAFSAIFIILSICTVVDRVLVPINYNKKVDSGYFYEQYNNEDNTNNDNPKAEETQPSDKPIKLEVTDANIVKVYVGKYISYINNKQFDKAYEMLTSNFKNINFQTQEKYEKYWNEKYPSYCSIKYNTFKRSGELIMVELEISDIVNPTEKIPQMFTLIKENGEYRLSFGIEE